MAALRCEKTLRGWLGLETERARLLRPKGVFLAESDSPYQNVPIRLFARVYSISPMGLGRLRVDSELRLDS
jgi:hypothetical protein